VDPHHVDGIRIQLFTHDTDPDADPDPTFHPDVDLDPSFQIKAQTIEKKVLKLGSYSTHFGFSYAN
jgi:hypothetical protein